MRSVFRLTVRGLMWIVAIVAVMIPPPSHAIFGLFAVLPFWILAAFALQEIIWRALRGIVILLSKCQAIDLPLETDIAYITSIVLCIFISFPFGLIAVTFGGMEADVLSLIIAGIIPLNLAGTCYALWRVGQRQMLLAGELIWAWQGVAWSVLVWEWRSLGLIDTLTLISEFMRLSFSIVTCAAIYGRRPTEQVSALPHKTGWILLCVNNVLCAWLSVKIAR